MLKGKLPDFPPKKWFGNTERSFVSQRKKHLENYLNTILKSIEIDKIPPLKEFLFSKIERKKETKKDETPTHEKQKVAQALFNNKNSINKKNLLEKITDKIVDQFVNIDHIQNMNEEEDVKKKKQMISNFNFTVNNKNIKILKLPTASNFKEKDFKKETVINYDAKIIENLNDLMRGIEEINKTIENYVERTLFVHEIK